VRGASLHWLNVIKLLFTLRLRDVFNLLKHHKLMAVLCSRVGEVAVSAWCNRYRKTSLARCNQTCYAR